MWYFVLSVLILILIIRQVLINAEIRNITKQLSNLASNKTQKRLTTTIANKNIQNMCAQINQNLTKQQEGQMAVKKHEEKLKHAISNLSHDLRTPLTSIIGYITMLKADKTKTEEYLHIIESRANTLNNLVNEFYELSIIEDGEYKLELEKIDVVCILTNVLMSNFALFEQKNITPKINIPDNAVNVIGNRDAYERVFQNLISNAVKYSEGDVNLSLLEKNENCIITISNKTSNLSKEVVEHLFDRFYTADFSRTNKNTGLGLYIVKTLCEKMGAKVRAKLSNEGVLFIEINVRI